MKSRLALLLPAACLLLLATRVDAQEITIYRCTDAKGKLTLRDAPCKRGEKQQTQQMLHPRDAPRAAVSRATPTPAPVTNERVRYVIQPSARPLYACIAPDGRRYTSTSPEGAARWVPGWAMDAPVPHFPAPMPRSPTRVSSIGAGVAYRGSRVDARIGGDSIAIEQPAPAYPYPYAMGGMWVRDACSEIPPEDACALLAERRSEISQGYYHAMPSERQRLDRESATLDARLNRECAL